MGLPDIENIPDTGAVFTIGRSRFAENVASHFFIRKDPVVSVTCGDEHSAVVCQSGRLFVFGSNDWGQLGLGHKNHVSKPSCVKVLKPEKVTHVACGRAHTLICTGEQKIFACGSDQESQLGRGSQAIGDSSSAPFLIHDCGNEGSKVRQIAAGSHHSLALLQDGTILAWGSNLEGQLGLAGTSGLVNKPTKVQIPETVKQISAGYYHSAFLTETGNVYVCGEAESGKLGIALDFRTQVAPKQMQLSGPAILVACGGHHTLIFGEDGNIYCTGSNSSGQLGMGLDVTEITTPKILPRGALQDESIKKIGCGESHIAIVTESGKLFTCGDGRHGKLGLEENENNVHELTQASRYNELVVTDVSCGGCHTILVGRRRETNNEVIDDHEENVSQKINPLPPLKIPVARISSGNASCEKPERFKMADESNANEVSSTETENSTENTNENAGASIGVEKPVSPKALADYDNSIVKVSSSTDENELKTERMVNNNGGVKATSVDVENNMADDKTEEEKVKDDRASSGSLNGEITNEENEKSANGVLETTEKVDSPPLPVPPPKPPRQKIGSADTSQSSRQGSSSSRLGSAGSRNKNDDERDEKIDKVSEVPIDDKVANDEDEEETNKTKNEDTGSARKSVASAKSIKSAKSVDSTKSAKSVSSEKSRSAKSKAGTDETAEADAQNSLDDVEDNVPIEEEPKIVPDDADVVQSPAPRTGKMAKLFKTKKQEVENGIKEISTISTKAKSKTCSIL